MLMIWQASIQSSGQDAGQTPTNGLEIGEGCVPNISLSERRKRLASGVIMFVISLVVLAVLITTGADRWWRLTLWLSFAASASGYFQWRDKT